MEANNSILPSIMERLESDPYFHYFKWRKRDNTLVEKFKWGNRSVHFERHDSTLDTISYIVVYSIRYNILNKWYEKYHYISLPYQRMHPSRAIRGYNFDFQDTFEFKRDWSDFEEAYQNLRDTVIECSKKFFSKYSTLNSFYESDVKKIIRDGSLPSEDSLTHKLIWLGLCKIISPDNLPKLKKIILEDMEKRVSRKYPDPDIANVWDRKDAIIKELDAYDFTDALAKDGLLIKKIHEDIGKL